MVSERFASGAIVSGIGIGVILLVYGMWLSAGQSWNVPAFAGGVIILAAIAVMVGRIAAVEEPAH